MGKLYFLDHIQAGWWGDATLVESQGKYLLMDTCRPEGTNITKSLDDMGVKELDLYCSHNHADHWGKIVEYINTRKVGTVYLPVDMKGTSKGNEIVSAAGKRGTKVVWLTKGSTFTCGSWKFEVLWRYGQGSPNNRSLVTMGTCHGIKYATFGDLGHEAAVALLKTGINIKADIYKASHHGSCSTTSYTDNNNSTELLKAVSPSIAVCNCNGEGPKTYRSWAKLTYNRLEDLGCNCYSVRHNGKICLDIRKVNGRGVVIPSAERNMKEIIKDGRRIQVNKSAKIFWKGNFLVPDKTDEDLAVEVMLQIHGRLLVRRARLGSRYDAVQAVVERYVQSRDALLWAIADYTLKGFAGTGNERIKILGPYYDQTQEIIKRVVPVAKQIISADNPWGNDPERTEKLQAEGFKPKVVQDYVNILLG